MAAAEPAAPWLGSGSSAFAYSALLIERLADADRAFAAVRAAADRAGAPPAISMLAVGHGYALTRMGRLDEALAAVRLGRSLVDLVPFMDSWASVFTGYIQLYRGDLEDSTRWCERAQATATARGERNALLFAWDVLGHRRLREGAADQACQHYARLEATVHQMGIGEPCLPPWPRHAISAYLAAGRVTDAERVLAWLDRSTQRLPCRFPRIAAATGRAQLAELRGDRDTAQARFRDALALHQQVDLPVEHAETLLGLRRLPAPLRPAGPGTAGAGPGDRGGRGRPGRLAGRAGPRGTARGRRATPPPGRAGPDRARTPGGRPGRHRSQQRPDRPPAIGVGQHRRDAPGADLRQAGHPLPAPADRHHRRPQQHPARRRDPRCPIRPAPGRIRP